MRRSTSFFLFIALQVFMVVCMFFHASYRSKADIPTLTESAQLVKELDLTDLSLFTEARYTRHLSQADVHAPFQDHPLSLEHFPSGSLVRPPAR